MYDRQVLAVFYKTLNRCDVLSVTFTAIVLPVAAEIIGLALLITPTTLQLTLILSTYMKLSEMFVQIFLWDDSVIDRQVNNPVCLHRFNVVNVLITIFCLAPAQAVLLSMFFIYMARPNSVIPKAKRTRIISQPVPVLFYY